MYCSCLLIEVMVEMIESLLLNEKVMVEIIEAMVEKPLGLYF